MVDTSCYSQIIFTRYNLEGDQGIIKSPRLPSIVRLVPRYHRLAFDLTHLSATDSIDG
jgi:hypothetical protein